MLPVKSTYKHAKLKEKDRNADERIFALKFIFTINANIGMSNVGMSLIPIVAFIAVAYIQLVI